MNKKQIGNGYYFGVGEPDIAGQPSVKSYDDFAPPIFVGELSEDLVSQNGGNLLNKKIKHLETYIKKKGNYKLPEYVLQDLEKLY